MHVIHTKSGRVFLMRLFSLDDPAKEWEFLGLADQTLTGHLVGGTTMLTGPILEGKYLQSYKHQEIILIISVPTAPSQTTGRGMSFAWLSSTTSTMME